jgi:SET domain-containing protein
MFNRVPMVESQAPGRLGRGGTMTTYIAASQIHGLGAYAQGRHEPGDLVDANPIHILHPDEVRHVLHTELKRYIFYLRESGADQDPDSCYALIAVGNISFCNHSDTPNCRFEIDETSSTISLYAERTIVDGTELSIDYGDFARDINETR